MTTEIMERSAKEEQAMTLAEKVQALVIASNEDRISAEEMIQGAKALEDAIFAERDPVCKETHALWKKQVARRDSALAPLQDARKIIKQKCIAYDSEMERIRQAEERRLQEEARKRAEEEALSAAAQAEAEGDKETAEAILEAPLDVAPVSVPKSSPAPSRLTAGREIWSAEVTNLMALVKAVAEGKQPIAYLLPNMTALNGQAKSLKQHMAIPGTKATVKKV